MRRRLLPIVCAGFASAASALPAAPELLAGQFRVDPPQVQSAAMRASARQMQDSGVLQELAVALNKVFYLPRDIHLGYAECGDSNAFYDSETRKVSLCLELLQGMAETLDGQFEEEAQEDQALAGAFVAVTLHEVGHALVDVLEIPVTGREEDAVDQLAAWMLIKADDVDAVLGAAATYYTDSELGDDDFSDEHSIDKQRYFNMVCWAYGSDPGNSQELIDSWELPEARAEGCAEEFALLDRSWTRLLKNHLRPDAASVGVPAVARGPLSVPTTRTGMTTADSSDDSNDDSDATESSDGFIEVSVSKRGKGAGSVRAGKGD